ncbi:MAG: hypothetical protein H0X49_04850 [Acidobacteria bacterium]|nr:hypothetical protein [Acidobacteriota bacterium]
MKIKFLEAARLKTKARAERKSRVGKWWIFKRADGSSNWQSELLPLSAVCRCRLICG